MKRDTIVYLHEAEHERKYNAWTLRTVVLFTFIKKTSRAVLPCNVLRGSRMLRSRMALSMPLAVRKGNATVKDMIGTSDMD